MAPQIEAHIESLNLLHAQLIEKKLNGTLTAQESKTLADVKRRLVAYLRMIEPRPTYEETVDQSAASRGMSREEYDKWFEETFGDEHN